MTITDEQREDYHNRQPRIDIYKLLVWCGCAAFTFLSWFGIIKFFTWIF